MARLLYIKRWVNELDASAFRVYNRLGLQFIRTLQDDIINKQLPSNDNDDIDCYNNDIDRIDARISMMNKCMAINVHDYIYGAGLGLKTLFHDDSFQLNHLIFFLNDSDCLTELFNNDFDIIYDKYVCNFGVGVHSKNELFKLRALIIMETDV